LWVEDENIEKGFCKEFCFRVVQGRKFWFCLLLVKIYFKLISFINKINVDNNLNIYSTWYRKFLQASLLSSKIFFFLCQIYFIHELYLFSTSIWCHKEAKIVICFFMGGTSSLAMFVEKTFSYWRKNVFFFMCFLSRGQCEKLWQCFIYCFLCKYYFQALAVALLEYKKYNFFSHRNYEGDDIEVWVWWQEKIYYMTIFSFICNSTMKIPFTTEHVLCPQWKHKSIAIFSCGNAFSTELFIHTEFHSHFYVYFIC
jgi:hypothetical protein